MWIALHLPQLPLDLACRRWPEALRTQTQQTMPLAIAEKRRIGWSNPAARQAGIEPGMPDSTARSRHAELIVLERDLSAENGAIIEAALWALHFTPQVACLPMGLLLDVKASLRLFGGLAQLLQGLRSGLDELGVTPWLAAAPTAGAAQLMALARDGASISAEQLYSTLDRLPVTLLQQATPHLDTLDAIGCRQLGQIRKLPRAGLIRRFGTDLLRELDQAYGTEPVLPHWYVPPERFEARLELAARVDNAEALLFAARRLLLQLSGWLTARHAAITRFSLLLDYDLHRRHEHAQGNLDIVLSQPSRDLNHLTLLLQERLRLHVLQAPVLEIGLRADGVEAMAPPNTELFPTAASRNESQARLMERLASRLGGDAIRQLLVYPDHRPERSSQCPPRSSAPTATASAARRQHSNREMPRFDDRPTWLLTQPIRLMVRQNKPFYQGSLTLLAGPERIESGWWDEHLVTRDYFIAHNAEHLLLWIYRERHTVGQEEPGWFLHGIFG